LTDIYFYGIKNKIIVPLDFWPTQVAALQVLDALLLKCRQLTDGPQMMTVLMEQQDLAELMYDVLYANHLPLLE
jgi:hypothetical protein